MTLSRSSITIILLSTTCALILPALAGIVSYLFYITKGINARVFVIFNIVTISAISCQKIPNGDWVFYLDRYEWAKDLTLYEFLGIEGKSHLFYFFLWMLAKLDLSAELLGFTLCMVQYLLLMVFCEIFTRKLGLSRKSKDKILFLFLSFPIFFALSLHIIRQMMAAPLVFISLLSDLGIIAIITALGGFLIHSSSIALMPFFFLKNADNFLKIGAMLLIAILISILLTEYLTLRFQTAEFLRGGETSKLGMYISGAILISAIVLMCNSNLSMMFRLAAVSISLITFGFGLMEVNFLFIRFLFMQYILICIPIYYLRRYIPISICSIIYLFSPFINPFLAAAKYSTLFPMII